jgi:phosphoglycolate phosphatase
MNYDIVSFDLDGTLVDTAAEIAEAANRALESHGMERRELAEVTRYIGHGTRELIKGLVAAAIASGRDWRHRATRRRARAWITTMRSRPARRFAYPGARAALERLSSAGIKLACVTNKELRHARRVLEVTGLEHFFALTIGGDTLPRKKPDASVLRHVVEVLRGEVHRTAHVGDSSIDIQAARNAGVAAWAVPYGYNAGVPIAEAKPERIFPGLLQLAEYDRRRSAATPERLPMAALEAVLWDVDGARRDRADGHRVAFNRAFEEAGLPWRWDDAHYAELLRITGGRERLLHDMSQRSDAPVPAGEREALARAIHRRKNAIYADLVGSGCIALRDGVLALMQDAASAACG